FYPGDDSGGHPDVRTLQSASAPARSNDGAARETRTLKEESFVEVLLLDDCGIGRLSIFDRGRPGDRAGVPARHYGSEGLGTTLLSQLRDPHYNLRAAAGLKKCLTRSRSSRIAVSQRNFSAASAAFLRDLSG